MARLPQQVRQWNLYVTEMMDDFGVTIAKLA
jgi:hypothetical protein